MARVKIAKPNAVTDPAVAGIFEWVTQMEGAVPNHFFVEMNFPEFFPAKLGATKVLWESGELSMEEIQHVGILVSKDNGCSYCTAAFCTILTHGLGTQEEDVKTLVEQGVSSVENPRLATLLKFALQVNRSPATTTDADVNALREAGLTDKGIVQLIHLVSDFGSYNRLNLALDTDYDYRDMWRALASQV
ncbi:carboxymuconolactone decarboxylase family protein [Candidatus Seongchinamella marina]|uniref:carboxymuconolactone decarboxylase family protein n=1 Tax=Candidatus Seongchinamella marina TaxID=2518990 RepID=UPI00242BD938|nr:carboxymuconolactone decarboxylase family protein [Candidatus Seongchinamella marina]